MLLYTIIFLLLLICDIRATDNLYYASLFDLKILQEEAGQSNVSVIILTSFHENIYNALCNAMVH
jgi:hypothetical protein